ncbi:bifunctional phosphopantothenoylcysteine decarboxylase/phosphopantothenate--cysteine ligase CoaBC [Gorillibacterium sp. CAU 1737]|uniref:bifunctional phosphopantothenoylcysteine decarboxylase/phosphopantothenate--cysteine ligase CoaBC n=1 Tax=Gorillibacterium sp. CAU 1737 TaxID=3140362 RepID=UPI0032612103
MKGKTVILGVCGGIAAYKAAALCSKLTQAGVKVHVVMTESATKLVGPVTFQALSHEAVRIDTFDELDPGVISHIDLADRADAVVVAPATANMLAKLAHGIADDMLSTILLATTAPILVAPAMNVHMYSNPATQANMELLRERGVQFIEPGIGQLACGYLGKGRMEEPEAIVEYVRAHFAAQEAPKPLAGKKVLITAGGTVERLDPVRYFTNDSSGKMGFALAEAARDKGAEVTVVAARVSEPLPRGVTVVRAESALQMEEAVLSRFAEMDLVVKAAAVADYRPVEAAPQKIKKTGETLQVTLVKNPDILEELGKRKEKQFLIGFAAETEQVETYAMDKLHRKNCDLLVANDVSRSDAGFGTETNVVTIFDKNGPALSLPLLSKRETAERILALALERMMGGGQA